VNSASYDYVSNPHTLYPDVDRWKAGALHYTVCYNDPLHAIVTLEGNTIDIEGMESSMFMGITREMTNNPVYDAMGRPVTSKIQTVRITLW